MLEGSEGNSEGSIEMLLTVSGVVVDGDPGVPWAMVLTWWIWEHNDM